MGKFFLQGLSHFLQAPAHIIVLFGLGLLLGQQDWRGIRIGLPVFLLTVTGGLLLTQVFGPGAKHDVMLLVIAVVIGGLLAVRLELPAWSTAMLAGAAGVLIGVDSAPSLIPGMKAMNIYAVLVGTAAGTSLAVLLLALFALRMRELLNGIILRVLGSWVVASALMVLALMFAPR